MNTCIDGLLHVRVWDYWIEMSYSFRIILICYRLTWCTLHDVSDTVYMYEHMPYCTFYVLS